MKISKKNFVAVFALVLCVLMSSCGGKVEETQDIVGDDWRANGTVVASGTITHDYESVDVLVTIDDNSAAFYRDIAEQVLFDSVSFPMTVQNAKKDFDSISFDDVSGDGESDVVIKFTDENKDTTQMVWIWDAENRYVFNSELSDLEHFVDYGDISTYEGWWQYTEETRYLVINSDSTWSLLNENNERIASGSLWLEDTGITLHFEDNGDVLQLYLSTSGDLLDNVNGGMYVRMNQDDV